jgi:acetyl esterase/lipase
MGKKSWWGKPWGALRTALGWLLEGFNPLAEINFLVSSVGYRKQVGINYGRLERQKLDVYSPKGEVRDLPVVVFFYGGSLRSGRRKDYRFVAEALTARGFVAVIPDYRVYPEAKFPTFIEDGASAVSWARTHIDHFGGDSSRLFLMGHSAGAYIAAMLALNPCYLERVGLSTADLRGFIGIAGAYDFLSLKDPRLIEIFDGTDGITETQPINFVTASAPPALLLHGGKDNIIPPRNTESLAERLREANRPVVATIYPQYRHLMILFVLASPFQAGEPVMEDIERFIRAQH